MSTDGVGLGICEFGPLWWFSGFGSMVFQLYAGLSSSTNIGVFLCLSLSFSNSSCNGLA